MQIGSVKINGIVVLAPLAGITNLPFRLLAKSYGCGLVYSEMISAKGLLKKSKKTVKLLEFTYDERPISIQIFGSNSNILAEAAQIIESLNADILDINFGCSVKKIIKTGSGSALMKDNKKVENILKKVRKSIKIPLTIKIRSGWSPSGKQAIRIAKIAQNCGVDAIAIHPRTATQGFEGKADWSIIKKIKNTISIPVIGNGDIKTAYDAIKMKKKTGCDYIMIGRAAKKNPLIFVQTTKLLKKYQCFNIDSIYKYTVLTTYFKNSIQHTEKKISKYIMGKRLF